MTLIRLVSNEGGTSQIGCSFSDASGERNTKAAGSPPAQASPLPMPCPVESEVSQERWRERELIQYKSLGLK